MRKTKEQEQNVSFSFASMDLNLQKREKIKIHRGAYRLYPPVKCNIVFTILSSLGLRRRTGVPNVYVKTQCGSKQRRRYSQDER